MHGDAEPEVQPDGWRVFGRFPLNKHARPNITQSVAGLTRQLGPRTISSSTQPRRIVPPQIMSFRFPPTRRAS